jgi:transposase-like protein
VSPATAALKLVGSTKTTTRGVTAMAETKRMTCEQVIGYLLCAGLDEQVDAFRNRPLEGRYGYLWLDAKVDRARCRGGGNGGILARLPPRPGRRN